METRKNLEHAVFYNSYSGFIPNRRSIGFKTHALRLQEASPPFLLADDYIANLGFVRDDLESEHSMRSFLMPAGIDMLSLVNQEDTSYLKKIKLPTNVPRKMALDAVIKKRRSLRHYTGDKIPLAYLATVLRAG